MANTVHVNSLGFKPAFIPQIKTGEKNNTWRIWPDKYVVPGDVVQLINLKTNEVFARAQITEKCNKTFGSLSKVDRAGHETFSGDDGMYKFYSDYYKIPVDEKTEVTIIKFQLL